ncbi:hypothetical protein D3C72_2554020 [compost metagenome]
MLANPNFGVTEFIGENNGLTILMQHFGVVTPRIMQRHHEKTEFHSDSFIVYRLVSARASGKTSE